jgi:hypothetical protein
MRVLNNCPTSESKLENFMLFEINIRFFTFMVGIHCTQMTIFPFQFKTVGFCYSNYKNEEAFIGRRIFDQLALTRQGRDLCSCVLPASRFQPVVRNHRGARIIWILDPVLNERNIEFTLKGKFISLCVIDE